MQFKNRFTKIFVSLWSLVLLGGSSYVMLDTFVIPKTMSAIAVTNTSTNKSSTSSSTSTTKTAASTSSKTAEVTATSYDDGNLKISISTIRKYGTTVYVADIEVSDPSQLKTAFANNSYGRNLKETTSDQATANNAILAINGDYYGFRDDGYVIRNGSLYRDTAASGTTALSIDSKGNFKLVDESTTTAKSLLSSGAQQVLSFGPGLVENGKVIVGENDEVNQSMSSNPRTAIGQIGTNHYLVVVSDGRTSESTGLSLYQMATIMKSYGVQTGYNLDGGGSSTLWFNGKIVNNPTGGGGSSERAVSDIIYFK